MNPINKNLYRVNVGFLINAPVGEYREITIENPDFELDEDQTAENLHIDLKISRVQQGILASADCTADLKMECVRCLDEFDQKLKSHFDELFSFHTRENVEADQYLPENGYMDLKEIIREYLMLEIPMSPLCKPDCKGLCPVCGANLNKETCPHTDKNGKLLDNIYE